MTQNEDWRFLPGIPAGFGVDTISLFPGDFPGFMGIPAADVYHLIAIPQGAERAAAAFWAKTRQVLRPGGVLYAGFAGRGRWLWGQRASGPAVAPRQIRQRLQRAGYQEIAIYGALPNHLRPVCLVPLQPALLRFALSHYPAGKRSLLRRAWARQIISRWGASFLPGYAVVAITNDFTEKNRKGRKDR